MHFLVYVNPDLRKGSFSKSEWCGWPAISRRPDDHQPRIGRVDGNASLQRSEQPTLRRSHRRVFCSPKRSIRIAAPSASVSVVPDASALMAFLYSEPGSDVVWAALSDAAMSAVNYSEVLKKAISDQQRLPRWTTHFPKWTFPPGRPQGSPQAIAGDLEPVGRPASPPAVMAATLLEGRGF